jgi:hypothetical protein
MTKSKVLLQLDVDEQPSSFDALVAVDSGVERLLQYGGVTAETVVSLVHGAMFTRGPSDLKNTAAFFGGSDVDHSTKLFGLARKAFFGPLRVSIMCDPNGANTTASAAVLCIERHIELSQASVVVLGGSGPVGTRVARIAAGRGAIVRVCSRQLARAEAAIGQIIKDLPQAKLEPYEFVAPADIPRICAGHDVLVTAGAAGVSLTNPDWMEHVPGVRIAIDLNAVPPNGLSGVDPRDSNEVHSGIICYGALGVGGLKMKIHKACLKQLFESNDRVLDTQTIYELGRFVAGYDQVGTI